LCHRCQGEFSIYEPISLKAFQKSHFALSPATVVAAGADRRPCRSQRQRLQSKRGVRQLPDAALIEFA
jgi:hypothetical protein